MLNEEVEGGVGNLGSKGWRKVLVRSAVRQWSFNADIDVMTE